MGLKSVLSFSLLLVLCLTLCTADNLVEPVLNIPVAEDNASGSSVIEDVNKVETLPPSEESPVTDAVDTNSTVANSSVVIGVKRFTCVNEEITIDNAVKMLNASVLQTELVSDPNVTSRTQPARCQLIFFYAPWCPYSIKAAPHINALPRHFPTLSFYGINAYKHVSLNSMYGVMAVPTLFLFHNGKPAARYNESEYRIEQIAAFITQYTGIEPSAPLTRLSADYKGPLPTTLAEDTDPWLIVAWIFLLLSAVYWFTKSSLYSTLVENLQNTWREAAAQHEHAD